MRPAHRHIRLFTERAQMAAALAFVVATGGCTFVEFEESPYAARDLTVVYSDQEDMTFLSWKLGDEANADAIDVELFEDGEYRHIALDEAPYPAEPYACGDDEQCLQYQVDGRYVMPDGESPIRITHENIWGGPRAELREVDQTFDIDPYAAERNEAVDPGLQDWFEENGVELRRDFEFQVVGRDDACQETTEGDWSRLEEPSGVDYDWVERPSCFAARPDRRNGGAPERAEPIEPIPELFADRQIYTPESTEAPVVYAVLLDLQIASEARCDRTKEELLGMIEEAFEERDESAELLDVYLPRSSEGDEIDTCDQQARRRYPVSTILQDARADVAGRDTRLVWTYVNNSQLPPSDELGEDLGDIARGFEDEEELETLVWGIGHEWMEVGAVLDVFTGWRSLGNKTFEADITTFADNHLPFKTMEHDSTTEVDIAPPEGSNEPRYFKVCSAEPAYDAIGDEPGEPPEFDRRSPAIGWPDGDLRPFYTIDLGEQLLVPNVEYEEHRVEVIVETCERFCDQPFRARSGDEYAQWREPEAAPAQEVCRWTE